jgi:hypothetical protein
VPALAVTAGDKDRFKICHLKRRPMIASLLLNTHKTTDYMMCKTSFNKLDRTPRDVNVENEAPPQQAAGYSGEGQQNQMKFFIQH